MPPPAGGKEPTISVAHLGREREPLVVIDDFSGMRDELFERARSARFRAGGAHYPGLRAPAAPDFIDRRRDLVASIVRDVFGLEGDVVLEMLAFALVTKPPEQLSPLQRIPHYDSPDGAVIAGMYYLLGPESGGTAFYRHRRTGFETITPERERAYHLSLRHGAEESDAPPAYCHGDSEHYAMIGEVAAKPDRLALYRGRMLHSGIVPPGTHLTEDPANGRLTMNLFFRGSALAGNRPDGNEREQSRPAG